VDPVGWGDPPGRVYSKSVWACETDSWLMIGYYKGDQSRCAVVRPFRCRMWRCRRCAPLVAYLDAERIGRGMATLGTDWWYLVLTIDPKRSKSPWAVFKRSSYMWRKGFHRDLAKQLGVKQGEVKNVQTWEVTKRGWPHLNVALHSPELSEWAEERGIRKGTSQPKFAGGRPRATEFCPAMTSWLSGLAVENGFGRVLWSERVVGVGGLAGYLAKTAQELAYGSEKCQVPHGAPLGFRRVRGSKGLVPKPQEPPSDPSMEDVQWQVCPGASLESYIEACDKSDYHAAKLASDAYSHSLSLADRTPTILDEAVQALEALDGSSQDAESTEELVKCLRATVARTVPR